MRDINLINELEYNKKYEEIGENLRNGDSFISDTVKLSKTVYKANEIVNITKLTEKYINNVTNSFIETFKNRGGSTIEQQNFANETAKIIYGELKEDIITVIPAPCGFGKSSITLEILKNQIKSYKNNETTNGIIIVTDRLDSLRDTEDELKKLGLDGFTYVLEGWNQDVCDNKNVKQSDAKMCTPLCPYFYKCKMYTQQKEQEKFPILLITNARLKECGESIKRYSEYKNGNRTVLLIDERPSLLDIVKVNTTLLNEIDTEISKCTYDSVAEKTNLQNKWKEISNIIENKMQRLRENYKRFIVSNINNELICKNDNEFMNLWEKYIGKNKYKRELQHIHTVLTEGGFYVYEKNTEFITTIGSKDLKDMYCDTFKTIIFDGTALYDPLYLGMYNKGSLKFLDIENTRLYKNLNINFYVKHKLTKTTFRDKKYLARACAKFVNARMKKGINNKGYIVSYKEQSVPLAQYINNTLKAKIAKLSNDEIHYFGNTKGKNGMQSCNIMFQFGWDTLPDYEYAIQWLSVAMDWKETVKYCNNIEKAEKLSEGFIVKNRNVKNYRNDNKYSSSYNQYEFEYQPLNQFKMFSIVTNFYQEVHRTKLRNYSCTTEKIEVNVFSQQAIILKMVEQLFPKCNVETVKDELECFKESKADSRKNKINGYDEFMKWYNSWDGSLTKAKDIKKICGINDKQWENLKKHEIVKEKLSKLYQPKRGQYCFNN